MEQVDQYDCTKIDQAFTDMFSSLVLELTTTDDSIQ